MNLFGLDLSRSVAVIAEIGVNHEGNIDVAARLVERGAAAGAHAVKFQSYTPERFISSADPIRFERVKRFGLNEHAHRRLAQVAADNGVTFLSSAISEDWVPLLAELSPAIKIASGDVTFEPVIAAAARSGKQVILSTGASNSAEVDRAVGWFKTAAGLEDVSDRLALLHCVACYPASIEETNLLSIPYMRERYGLATGWSNHVIGPDACIAAVALGASIIEVHVTDKRDGRTFRDHELSFEPEELARLVTVLSGVRLGLGVRGKRPSPSEEGIRLAIRKGIVAARDLSVGTVLSQRDLMFARPATAFDAGELDQVVGKVLSEPLRAGESLSHRAVSLKF